MANEPKPAIMTLHNRSAQVLTKPADQIAYAIRWFFVNPGSTSSVNEEEMISFRKLNATAGTRPEVMAGSIQNLLTQIARRYYKTANVFVKVVNQVKTDEDGILQGTYGLEILVSDENNMPIIPTGHVVVTGEFDKIDCVFSDK